MLPFVYSGKDWLQIRFGGFSKPHSYRDEFYAFTVWVYLDFSSLSEEFELPDGLTEKVGSLEYSFWNKGYNFIGLSGPYVLLAETYRPGRETSFKLPFRVPLVKKGTPCHICKAH